MTRLAILDYGMGNLRSVEKAVERAGSEAVITSEHAVAREADGLILPGVGAFARAMERIEELELDELIAERVQSGTPVLGICLGFQLLFDSSTELGGAGGLGLIEGPVEGLGAGCLDERLRALRGDPERDPVLLRSQLRAAGRRRGRPAGLG